jgi:hypothetical protein
MANQNCHHKTITKTKVMIPNIHECGTYNSYTNKVRYRDSIPLTETCAGYTLTFHFIDKVQDFTSHSNDSNSKTSTNTFTAPRKFIVTLHHIPPTSLENACAMSHSLSSLATFLTYSYNCQVRYTLSLLDTMNSLWVPLCVIKLHHS